MACLNTNGIQRSCDFAIGGVKSSIWIGNEEDWSFKYATTGQITGSTDLNTGSTFYEFQQELQSASLTQSLQAGTVSRFVSEVLVLAFASLTQAKIETLNTISLTKSVAIFQANDGNWYAVGDNGSGLKTTALEITTGAADADAATATLTMTAANKGYAPTVAVAALAAMGIS